MKFTTKFLIAICLISTILTGKLKSNNNNAILQKPPTPKNETGVSNYKLLIVGDQGQFEYFKKSYEDVKPLKEKQEKIDRIFNNTTYDVADRKCKITILVKDPKSAKEFNKTMDLTDLSKMENRVMGMKNFDDLITTNGFQTQVDLANGIVFLGDTIYPENKRLAEVDGKKNATLGSQEKWNTRLQCAWNIFTSALVKVRLFKNEKLDERVDILTGNHSYDVSFNKEAEIVATLKKRKENSEFYEWNESENQAKITTKENPTSYFHIKKLTINPQRS